MNEKQNKLKNPLIAAVALALVAFAGYMYAGRERGTDELLTDTVSTSEVAAVEGDLLRTLNQLRRLHLDQSIFSDPSWASLTDFGKNLIEEPKGRQNPFAPLSGN